MLYILLAHAIPRAVRMTGIPKYSRKEVLKPLTTENRKLLCSNTAETLYLPPADKTKGSIRGYNYL